jgi:hypothetical protein
MLVDDVVFGTKLESTARYSTVIGCAHMVIGPVTEELTRSSSLVRAGTQVTEFEGKVVTQPANKVVEEKKLIVVKVVVYVKPLMQLAHGVSIISKVTY